MRRTFIISANDRFANTESIEVTLEENLVRLVEPGEFHFVIDNVEAATTLRAILDVYIAIQRLET